MLSKERKEAIIAEYGKTARDRGTGCTFNSQNQ